MASPASVALCQHIKTNGLRCNSPALHRQRYCHAHRQHHVKHTKRAQCSFTAENLPVLEDGNAIQVAVMNVLRALLADSLDQRRAGLLLYGLQIASANLKRVDFEPRQLRAEQPSALVAKPVEGVPASSLPALARIFEHAFHPAAEASGSGARSAV